MVSLLISIVYCRWIAISVITHLHIQRGVAVDGGIDAIAAAEHRELRMRVVARHELLEQ